MLEKSLYLEFFGPYFPVLGLNTVRWSVSPRIQSECEKMWTRKTSNTDTLHLVKYLAGS